MSGNVWEWCMNEWERAASIDPRGGANRAVRGGSWLCDQTGATATVRIGVEPFIRSVIVGFRLVWRGALR
jgi:formylglycine-generating enzyme required for sulfatase activity